MSSPSAAAVSVHVREVDHVPKVGLVSKLKGKFPKHDEDSTLFTLAGIRVLCVLQETTANAAAVHGLYHWFRKVHNNKVSCQQDHIHLVPKHRHVLHLDKEGGRLQLPFACDLHPFHSRSGSEDSTAQPAGPAVLRTNDSTALSLIKPLLQPPVPEAQDTKG